MASNQLIMDSYETKVQSLQSSMKAREYDLADIKYLGLEGWLEGLLTGDAITSNEYLEMSRRVDKIYFRMK